MRGPKNRTRTGSWAPRPKMAKRAPDSGQASKRPPKRPLTVTQEVPRRLQEAWAPVTQEVLPAAFAL
eukprot:7810219-Pyramimonas_sp.AAC.1